MKKSIIVFGIGKFGSAVATKLFESGMEVMVVDRNYDRVEEIANEVTAAVNCDFLDKKAMDQLGISNFDIAIVAAGTNLEASIIATMIAKENGVKKVVAKASSSTHARILKKLGANQIVYPELDMGERLARSITESNLLEFIHFSEEYNLVELEAVKEWYGKSLADMDFRNRYHSNVVAIRRGEEIIVTPSPTDKLREGDILVLIGKEEYIDNLEKINK